MRGASAVAILVGLACAGAGAARAGAAPDSCWPVREEGVSRYGQIEVFKNTNLEGPNVYTSCWRPTGKRRVFLRTAKEGPGSTERFQAGPQAAGQWLVWEMRSPVAGGLQIVALHSYNALSGRRGPVVSFGAGTAAGEAAHPEPEDNGFGVFEELVLAANGWYAWATANGTALYAPNGRGGYVLLDSAPSPPGLRPAPIKDLSVRGSVISWTHAGSERQLDLATLDPHAAPRDLSLRLIPGTVSGPGSARTGPSTARGTVRLGLPAAWGAPVITRGDSVGRLHVALAPGCEAEIETGNGWIGNTALPIRLEMEDTEDFWFGVFAPVKPRPVPLAASQFGPTSAWELATPPPSSSGSHISPFYGTAARRLGSTQVWGTVHIGVRAPAGCVGALPGRALLQHQLESVLRSAAFALRQR